MHFAVSVCSLIPARSPLLGRLQGMGVHPVRSGNEDRSILYLDHRLGELSVETDGMTKQQWTLPCSSATCEFELVTAEEGGKQEAITACRVNGRSMPPFMLYVADGMVVSARFSQPSPIATCHVTIDPRGNQVQVWTHALVTGGPTVTLTSERIINEVDTAQVDFREYRRAIQAATERARCLGCNQVHYSALDQSLSTLPRRPASKKPKGHN